MIGFYMNHQIHSEQLKALSSNLHDLIASDLQILLVLYVHKQGNDVTIPSEYFCYQIFFPMIFVWMGNQLRNFWLVSWSTDASNDAR